MAARMKGLVPLALAIGVLAFVYVEAALNFTFHWVTAGDLGNGLALPSNFHLVVPAAFVSWGMYFAAGGDGGWPPASTAGPRTAAASATV